MTVKNGRTFAVPFRGAKSSQAKQRCNKWWWEGCEMVCTRTEDQDELALHSTGDVVVEVLWTWRCEVVGLRFRWVKVEKLHSRVKSAVLGGSKHQKES